MAHGNSAIACRGAVEQAVGDRRLHDGGEIGGVGRRERALHRRARPRGGRSAVLRPEKEKSQPGRPSIGRGRAKRAGSPVGRRRSIAGPPG